MNNSNKLRFSQPNFDFEWTEAAKIPEFKDMGKKTWQEFAKTGNKVKYSTICQKDINKGFIQVDQAKKKRFEKAFENGVIEMPIIVKFDDTHYEVLAGKTRIDELTKKNIDLDVWVIDISEMVFLIRPVEV